MNSKSQRGQPAWALGTLGLGDPGPWGPLGLEDPGPWGPPALGTPGRWGPLGLGELTSDASHLSWKKARHPQSLEVTIKTMQVEDFPWTEK